MFFFSGLERAVWFAGFALAKTGWQKSGPLGTPEKGDRAHAVALQGAVAQVVEAQVACCSAKLRQTRGASRQMEHV